MPDKGKYYDNIDRFLSGQLTAKETEAMQKAMEEDTLLAQEIAVRRLEFEVSEALIANSIRSQLQHLQAPHPPDPGLAVPPQKHQIFLPNWWIAAIIALAAIGIYWWYAATPSREKTTPAPTGTPLVPSDTPGQARPQADIQTPPALPSQRTPGANSPARYLALADKIYQKPDVETFRGAEASNTGDPFENALAAWAQEDYANVVTTSAKVPANDPKYIRALYLRAHAHYQLRQFDAAVALFTAVSDRRVRPYSEDADGYLLLALLATGQANTSNFQAHLRQVLADPGHPWHEQALEIKQRL